VQLGPDGRTYRGPGETEYTFEVEATPKGAIDNPATLWTSDQEGTCGIGLDIGARYKLYPYLTEDGRYDISLCGGNRRGIGYEVLQAGGTPSTAHASTTTTLLGVAVQRPVSGTVVIREQQGSGASAAKGLTMATGGAAACSTVAAAMLLLRRRRLHPASADPATDGHGGDTVGS
jgi:hypothetical protein